MLIEEEELMDGLKMSRCCTDVESFCKETVFKLPMQP